MPFLETVGTLLGALLSLVLVLALAYVTIKWMSGRMVGQKGGGRAIRVVDRVGIGQDKCLLVVQVGGQTMLIGMSGDSVAKLADLPDLPEQDLTQSTEASPEFSDILRDTIRDGWKKISKKGEEPK